MPALADCAREIWDSGNGSRAEQGVRRGAVFSQAILPTGPSLALHELIACAPRGAKGSECLTPSGFLLPDSGLTVPPPTGNQRFLFTFFFSLGCSASGYSVSVRAQDPNVGCTYKPWVTSLTLREMQDHLESFGIEQPLLLWERFGAGLHGAAVVMPLSKSWGSWYCSRLAQSCHVTVPTAGFGFHCPGFPFGEE